MEKELVMNAAHLHLAINHLPVVGVILVLPLLVWAIFRNSLELVRVALTTFVGIAVAALVVYLTGEPAEDVIEALPGFREASVEAHERAALLSLGFSVALGILGLFGLWRLRASSTIPRWVAVSAFIGTLVVALSMAWTAHLGGLIRHPEVARGFVARRAEALATRGPAVRL